MRGGLSFASHLRAADIVAERIGAKTYRITVTVYTDFENVPDTNLGGAISAAQAPIQISDGTNFNVPRTAVQFIGNGTFENKYVFDHTFPTAGAGYFIRYTEENRNAGVINIGGASDQQSLFVETFIFIDAFDPNFNRTPQLLVPPIDLANVGQIYTHNPGAFDLDGDSISFRLIVPQKSVGVLVNDYKSPADPMFGGGATFSLNPLTGDIVWNTPLTQGEYNIAFMVEEWRGGVRIGYVIRDMQIIVENSNNIKPEFVIPADTCAIATEFYQDTIIGYDPDGHTIGIQYFGGMFETSPDSAFVLENVIAPDSIIGQFNWTPTCDFIQNLPHQAIFKVEDYPSSLPKLATLKTWQLSVLGPGINGITSLDSLNGVLLTWDLYQCGSVSDKIIIWRRSCDTSMIERNHCTTGVPASWGFEKVGEVSGVDTLFYDNNGGAGLDKGVVYYYILSVEFGAPNFGESVASSVVSGSVGLDMPILKSVDVVATDSLTGQINVSWFAPIDFDETANPGPYMVNVYRQLGSISTMTNGTLVGGVTMNSLVDSSFLDSNFNTRDTSYSYYLELVSGVDTLGVSGLASSVWLRGEPFYERIDLEWDASVPWSTPDSLYQLIWIDSTGTYGLLDSVSGGVTRFTVDSLVNCEEYCFYIETRGIYCHDSINTDVLVSKSQVMCTVPIDTVPPCQPNLSLTPIDCELFNESSPIQNHLFWTNTTGGDCDLEPVVGYKLYIRQGIEGNFQLLTAINDTVNKEFFHDSLLSMSVCYVITAIDKSGNESAFSNIVCGDNCEYLELPNVFTPNGMGPNDRFIPIPTPRFVREIDFEVYNRWGELVFRNRTTSEIGWDGKNLRGKDLSDGIYYYRAIVEFDRLNPEDAIKEIKGWVLIMR